MKKLKIYNNFEQSSDIVAQELLGKTISTRIDGYITSGIIVETESYEGYDDPASHGFIGKTERNFPIFEIGGTIYIYKIYGQFYLLNVVTNMKDYPSSVFIRAIQPVEGIDIMIKRRNTKNIKNLANGPGKLTSALGIDKSLNNRLINIDNIFIYDTDIKDFNIVKTTRIGISKGKDLLKRFYIEGSQWISKK